MYIYTCPSMQVFITNNWYCGIDMRKSEIKIYRLFIYLFYFKVDLNLSGWHLLSHCDLKDWHFFLFSLFILILISANLFSLFQQLPIYTHLFQRQLHVIDLDRLPDSDSIELHLCTIWQHGHLSTLGVHLITQEHHWETVVTL